MGTQEQKSLTESGLKYIYQYFFLHFCLILVLILISVALSLMQQDMLSITASKFYFVVAIIFLFILVFIWFIRGLALVLNGRMEFSEPHESNVIMATILIVVYLILYFINLSISQGFTGGTAFIAAASAGFSSSILLQFIAVVVLSITSSVLFGLALGKYLIQKFASEEQKKKLKIAFILLVASTFTFNITGLIAYILFFKVYQEVYFKIKAGEFKAAQIAPCPNCAREIPVESQACQYCGSKFEKNVSAEIDPRLHFNAPKSEFTHQPGYTPTEGPTAEQKKKLYYLIGLIIVIIVVIAVLMAIF